MADKPELVPRRLSLDNLEKNGIGVLVDSRDVDDELEWRNEKLPRLLRDPFLEVTLRSLFKGPGFRTPARWKVTEPDGLESAGLSWMEFGEPGPEALFLVMDKKLGRCPVFFFVVVLRNDAFSSGIEADFVTPGGGVADATGRRGSLGGGGGGGASRPGGAGAERLSEEMGRGEGRRKSPMNEVAELDLSAAGGSEDPPGQGGSSLSVARPFEFRRDRKETLELYPESVLENGLWDVSEVGLETKPLSGRVIVWALDTASLFPPPARL